jgi:hypothetical protein
MGLTLAECVPQEPAVPSRGPRREKDLTVFWLLELKAARLYTQARERSARPSEQEEAFYESCRCRICAVASMRRARPPVCRAGAQKFGERRVEGMPSPHPSRRAAYPLKAAFENGAVPFPVDGLRADLR